VAGPPAATLAATPHACHAAHCKAVIAAAPLACLDA